MQEQEGYVLNNIDFAPQLNAIAWTRLIHLLIIAAI